VSSRRPGGTGPCEYEGERFVSRDFEVEFTQRELEAYFERWRPTFAGAGFHNRVNSRVARSYVAKSLTCPFHRPQGRDEPAVAASELINLFTLMLRLAGVRFAPKD
jgi:hypothetical protein